MFYISFFESTTDTRNKDKIELSRYGDEYRFVHVCIMDTDDCTRQEYLDDDKGLEKITTFVVNDIPDFYYLERMTRHIPYPYYRDMKRMWKSPKHNKACTGEVMSCSQRASYLLGIKNYWEYEPDALYEWVLENLEILETIVISK